jgi:hypothetical protein
MGYFRELPSVAYQSPLPDKLSSRDYVIAKNLFRKVKLLDYLEDNALLFNKYHIEEGERPDTIAAKMYGDSELDYIVILSAGITNIRNEWPLNHQNLYEYAEAKYGIEKLNAPREVAGRVVYETVEVRDDKDRLVLPKGLVIDDGFVMDGPGRRYQSGPWKAIRPNGTVEIEKNLAEIGGTGHALLSLISVSLTNYQYETRENEKKRSITLLRPSYLDMFKEDLRRIMRYDRNSQYISPKLIKSENTTIVE